MPTIPRMLLDRIDRGRQRVFSRSRVDGAWVASTGADCEASVASTAMQLRELGVAPGHRVAILGPPHARWLECDFALLSLGAITVGIYPTLAPDAVRYQLAHSGCTLLLAPASEHARLAPAAAAAGVELRSWEFERRAVDVAGWRDLAGGVAPEQVAGIVYTSGTTGDPKGVVLTHRNLHAVAEATRSVMPLRPGDRSVVFLPLAHSLQRVAVYRGLLDDAEAWFCERVADLPDVLLAARPSILASVPRMLETIKARAEAQVAAKGGAAAAVFGWAMRVGLERSACVEAGRPVPPGLALELALADRLVHRKVRGRLGGEIHTLCCGGARLDPSVARFYHALGITVLEAWGLTETSAPATLNLESAFRFGTVGRPLPGVDLRLDTDGEVLVRGPGVFGGYWQDPESTAAAFTPDGFFRSGDIGEIDADGFLRIVDRKKEIIVTSGGKKIPPVGIEKRLEGGPVGQAVVVGDDRPYLVALLAPDPDVAADGRDAVARARVEAVNAGLSPYERIKKWTWLPGPLTTEDGLLTPTMKLRRRSIAQRYAAEIEALYSG